jgi:hypothetical protein
MVCSRTFPSRRWLIPALVYILSASDKETAILSGELETIKGLTKIVRNIGLVRDVPSGCGSPVLLTSESSLYVDVLVC